MKKELLPIGLICLALAFAPACTQEETEETGEEIQESVEEAGEAVQDAAEEAGDAVEDATDN